MSWPKRRGLPWTACGRALGAAAMAAVAAAPVAATTAGPDAVAYAAPAAPVLAPTTTPSSPAPSSPAPAASSPAPSSPIADESIEPEDEDEEATDEPVACEQEPEPAQWREQEPWAQEFLAFQEAWPYATGEGVTVAVLDTGLARNPQFGGASFAMDEARDFTSGEPMAFPYWDCGGHGTGVTGLIVANESPHTEFVGVAPDATILPLRVTATTSSGEGGLQQLADAIRYAVDQDVDIINISLEADVDFPALRAAVEYAAQQQVLVVAASGNHGHQGDPTTYPAAYAAKYPNVISVGAVDRTGRRPPFSGTSAVTVMAPGVDITSTHTLQGNSEELENGTSFAAPIVTGAAALVLDASGQRLTPAQVRRRISAAADPPPGGSVPDPAYGYGTLNVIAAVTGEFPQSEHTSESTALVPLKPAPPPDHTMRNVAVSITIGAVVLVLGVIAGVATGRKGRARGWRPGVAADAGNTPAESG